jgi:predicted GIY-YIG superfamily endonuclease
MKTKKPKVVFTVYKLTSEGGLSVYIGHTNNIERRISQHRNNIKNGKSTLFYDALVDGTFTYEILSKFKTKVEAKRYEMYLILQRYYSGEKLYQKIPNISDR